VIEGCPGWKVARAQGQTTHPGPPRQRPRIRRSRYAPCRPIADRRVGSGDPQSRIIHNGARRSAAPTRRKSCDRRRQRPPR
jgi:hypothetical protein